MNGYNASSRLDRTALIEELQLARNLASGSGWRGSWIEALPAKPFWSNPTLARFHADPHAGNLFVTNDGRLAILDWALVTPLSKAQRVAVVQAVASALTLNKGGLSRALAALGHPL